MGGTCSTSGKEEECISVIGGKPEGKKPLGRPRHRWVDNIKMGLGERGLGGGIDWIGTIQDWDKWRALVNAVMNLRIS
jgi:hypothetical protein